MCSSDLLDQEGVGELIRIGIERGRRTRPDLKIGICGEHGGDPASIAFCNEIGLDYVSCSPFRVPVARLAAAQAALEAEAAKAAQAAEADQATPEDQRKAAPKNNGKSEAPVEQTEATVGAD